MACQVPAQLIVVTVCSIVLSRHLLFELPEQSTALQVFSFLCLTQHFSQLLLASFHFVTSSVPGSLILHGLPIFLVRRAERHCRGLEVRCSTPGGSM